MIDLKSAFKQALKGLSLWWLPLCGLSFIILVNQEWVPAYLGEVFEQDKVLTPIMKIAHEFEVSYNADPFALLEAISVLMEKSLILAGDYEFLLSVKELAFKWIMACIYFILILLPLYMSVIIVAKSAVREKENQTFKRDFGSIVNASIALLIQMIVKSFCMVIFIPGIYFYIRLMFSGIILAEEKCGPFKAMQKSWVISRGQFSKLLVIYLAQIVVLICEMFTILGFIPGEPFKYTLRSAAYWQLKEKEVSNG